MKLIKALVILVVMGLPYSTSAKTLTDEQAKKRCLAENRLLHGKHLQNCIDKKQHKVKHTTT